MKIRILFLFVCSLPIFQFVHGATFEIEQYLDNPIDSGRVLSNSCELVYGHDDKMCYTYFKTVYDDIKILDKFLRKPGVESYIHFFEDHEHFLVIELKYTNNDGDPYLLMIDKYTGKILMEGVTIAQINEYGAKIEKRRSEQENVVTEPEKPEVEVESLSWLALIAAHFQNNLWYYIFAAVIVIVSFLYWILQKQEAKDKNEN